MYSEIPGGLIARTQVHSLIREQRSHKPLSMDKKKRVQMNQMNSQNRNRFIVIKNKHIANKVVGGINWENGIDLYNYPICDVVPVRVDWSSGQDLTSTVVNVGKTGKGLIIGMY